MEPWAIVKDSSGSSFGMINGSTLVRNTTSSVLVNTGIVGTTTNYTTNPAVDTGPTSYNGGTTLTLPTAATNPINSLFINAGSTGVLDLGGNTGTAP